MQIDKKTLLWIVIAVLFIVTLFVFFKAGSGSAATGQAANAVKSAASSAMVGGC